MALFFIYAYDRCRDSIDLAGHYRRYIDKLRENCGAPHRIIKRPTSEGKRNHLGKERGRNISDSEESENVRGCTLKVSQKDRHMVYLKVPGILFKVKHIALQRSSGWLNDAASSLELSPHRTGSRGTPSVITVIKTAGVCHSPFETVDDHAKVNVDRRTRDIEHASRMSEQSSPPNQHSFITYVRC